jgi:aspartate/methionine/tyrosine aminotransferase
VVLENRRAEFSERRDFLYDSLLRFGFESRIKPESAFYSYANCKKFTGDSYQFALDFLEAEVIAITPRKDFEMAIAMQRLDRFISK